MGRPIILKGGKLQVRPVGGADGDWVDVLGVTAVTIPEPTADRVETTSLDTTSNKRTFIPGLEDVGDVTFVQNYTTEAWEQLEEDQGVAREYRFLFKSQDGGVTLGDQLLWPDAQRSGSEVLNGLGALVQISNRLVINADRVWIKGIAAV